MDQTELKFIQQIKNKPFFTSQDRLLVAVSGGSDSLALLALLLKLPAALKAHVEVATVDFDLRAHSSQEVELVRHFCAQQQVPFHTTVWQHNSNLKAMEVQARIFRYNFFAELMHQYHLNKLVTAHQNDDQVETVLMKLIRSGSFWESGGILPQRSFAQGQLIRPLLNFSKSELKDYLQRRHIKFAVDESNFQDITMRNRLRNEVIPLLQAENPHLNQHVAAFVEQQQTLQKFVQAYFQNLAQQVVQSQAQGWQVNLLGLQKLPPLMIALFLQNFIHLNLNLELNQQQLLQLQQLLAKPQGHLDVAKGWGLDKFYQRLVIQPQRLPFNSSKELFLKLDQPILANEQQKITIKQSTQKSASSFYFDHLPHQIVLRTRHAGDQVRLFDGHYQKLKKRLIDQKIPQDQREQLWVLVFDGQIVWIPGVYRYQVSPTPYLFEIIIGE